MHAYGMQENVSVAYTWLGRETPPLRKLFLSGNSAEIREHPKNRFFRPDFPIAPLIHGFHESYYCGLISLNYCLFTEVFLVSLWLKIFYCYSLFFQRGGRQNSGSVYMEAGDWGWDWRVTRWTWARIQTQTFNVRGRAGKVPETATK